MDSVDPDHFEIIAFQVAIVLCCLNHSFYTEDEYSAQDLLPFVTTYVAQRRFVKQHASDDFWVNVDLLSQGLYEFRAVLKDTFNIPSFAKKINTESILSFAKHARTYKIRLSESNFASEHPIEHNTITEKKLLNKISEIKNILIASKKFKTTSLTRQSELTNLEQFLVLNDEFRQISEKLVSAQEHLKHYMGRERGQVPFATAKSTQQGERLLKLNNIIKDRLEPEISTPFDRVELARRLLARFSREESDLPVAQVIKGEGDEDDKNNPEILLLRKMSKRRTGFSVLDRHDAIDLINLKFKALSAQVVAADQTGDWSSALYSQAMDATYKELLEYPGFEYITKRTLRRWAAAAKRRLGIKSLKSERVHWAFEEETWSELVVLAYDVDVANEAGAVAGAAAAGAGAAGAAAAGAAAGRGAKLDSLQNLGGGTGAGRGKGTGRGRGRGKGRGGAAEGRAVRVVANITYTYEQIRNALKEVANREPYRHNSKILALRFSPHYIRNLLNRQNFVKRRVTTETKAVPEDSKINAKMKIGQDIYIHKRYEPEYVWNYDETALTYGIGALHMYVPQGSKRAAGAYGESPKVRVTAIVLVSSGGIAAPSFIILKHAISVGSKTDQTGARG